MYLFRFDEEIEESKILFFFIFVNLLSLLYDDSYIHKKIAFGKSVYFRLPGSTLKFGRFQKSNQALNERGESGASAKGADEIGR